MGVKSTLALKPLIKILLWLIHIGHKTLHDIDLINPLLEPSSLNSFYVITVFGIFFKKSIK